MAPHATGGRARSVSVCTGLLVAKGLRGQRWPADNRAAGVRQVWSGVTIYSVSPTRRAAANIFRTLSNRRAGRRSSRQPISEVEIELEGAARTAAFSHSPANLAARTRAGPR